MSRFPIRSDQGRAATVQTEWPACLVSKASARYATSMMERVGCPPIKRFVDSLGASLDDLDQRFAMYAFKSNESALSLVMTENPLSMYGIRIGL